MSALDARRKEEFRKPQCYQKRFDTMADAAKYQLKALTEKAYKPKDLELFHASAYQQRSCFRGYDKITTSPHHGSLPKWNIKQSTILKLSSLKGQ